MYILCALAGLSLLHQLNQYILNFCHLKWRKWRFACEKLSKKQTKYSLLAWKSLCRQSHIVHSLRVLSQHRDFSLVLCRSRNAQHQDHTASAMVMQIWAPTAFLSTYLPPATRSSTGVCCGVRLRSCCGSNCRSRVPCYWPRYLNTQKNVNFLLRRVLLSSRSPALPSPAVGGLCTCTCTWVKFEENENREE